MARPFGLVVDLHPFDPPAGPEDIARLEAPLRERFGLVRTWHPAREGGDPAGAGAIDAPGLAAVVLSGSEAFVEDGPRWLPAVRDALEGWVERAVPTLAICFSHQLLAHTLGGTLARRKTPRRGVFPMHRQDTADPLFEGLGPEAMLGYTHTDVVVSVPDEVQVLAGSADCPVEALRLPDRPVWGLQPHPEYDRAVCRLMPEEYRTAWKKWPPRALDTPAGETILANFTAYAAGKV